MLPNGNLPTVSVVVPVYNRADLVERCVDSLNRQPYPQFEIILVDDGSDDDTSARLRAIVQNADRPIQLIRQSNHGPAHGRNTGLHASGAEIVAFLDSDCAASDDWLTELVHALTQSKAAGVGGLIIEPGGRGWIVDYISAAGFFRQRVKSGSVDYLLTANAAFCREALNTVGGFTVRNGAWSEDADLSFRLKQAGYRLTTTEHSVVTHYGSPTSLKGFVRMAFRYGKGNALLSSGWHNERNPGYEAVRHIGAMILAPVLALRLVISNPPLNLLPVMVLIAVQHGAFVVGLLGGIIARYTR